MQPKHKMFFDELHALLMKYNITRVRADEDKVMFAINDDGLSCDERFSFLSYRNIKPCEPKFSQVAVDYRPEDLPELESEYSGEENFDD